MTGRYNGAAREVVQLPALAQSIGAITSNTTFEGFDPLVKEIVRNQGVQSESAVLVGVELPDQQAGRDNLEELAGLVETAGAEVVGRLTQRRSAPDVDDLSRQGQSSNSWS